MPWRRRCIITMERAKAYTIQLELNRRKSMRRCLYPRARRVWEGAITNWLTQIITCIPIWFRVHKVDVFLNVFWWWNVTSLLMIVIKQIQIDKCWRVKRKSLRISSQHTVLRAVSWNQIPFRETSQDCSIMSRTIKMLKYLVLKTGWVINNIAYVIWGTTAQTRRLSAKYMTRSSRWKGLYQAIGKWTRGKGTRVRRYCRYSRRTTAIWAPISHAYHARTMIRSTSSVPMSLTLSRIQRAW